MLGIFYNKIKLRLDEIKRLKLIKVDSNAFSSDHKSNLRLASAFVLDFYLDKLKNYSERTGTLQRLENKVSVYRDKLRIVKLSPIEAISFLEEMLKNDPLVLNDYELITILLARADFEKINRVKIQVALLDCGINYQSPAIIQALLEAGIAINNQTFIQVCETGNSVLVKLLLSSKNLEETLNLNHAFHKVCGRGFTEIAECLLSLGADVNFHYDFRGLVSTPLSEALRLGYVKLAQQLIKQGADIIFAQKILAWSDFTLAIVLRDSYRLLRAYEKGESIDLLNVKSWSLVPKALQQIFRGEACDITYLLHVMPNNQLPKPCPASRQNWSAVSAKIPEAKKAYAIIRLQELLKNYHQQRNLDTRETYFGFFSLFFGGFSKQEKLATVEKILNHFSGKGMGSLTSRELKVLNQGKLGENLRVWEKENKTSLQDTALWFEINILSSHLSTNRASPAPG